MHGIRNGLRGGVVAVATVSILLTMAPPPASGGVSESVNKPATKSVDDKSLASSVGEVKRLRTATSRTERDAKGRLHATFYSTPVNYLAQDGSWERIDTRLRPAEQSGRGWENDRNAFTTRFADRAGDDVVAVDLGAQKLSMSAVGTAGSSVGRAAGGSITYPKAFASTDLRYDVLSTGIKESLVLLDATAPTSYQFRIALSGQKKPQARRLPDGSWSLSMAPVPDGGAILERPTVVEAPAEARELSPADARAKPSLDVRRDEGELVATVSIDPHWLSAPERRFPVVIDPTITIQPTVDDMYWTNEPGFTGNWGDDRLYIGGSLGSSWRSGVKFDTSSVPAGVTVSSASLGLYFDGYCISGPAVFCGGTAHTMDLHRMSAPWSSATGSSDVRFDSAVVSSFTLPQGSPEKWMMWDATSLVRSWVSGAQPNDGMMVTHAPEVNNSSGPVPPGRRFTANPGVQPKLEVVYVSDAVDLATPQTVHSNGAELAWSVFSSGSGAAFDRYEVHRSTGSAPFTPSASTLLTTIRDRNTTAFVDTTAAAASPFSYRIVANSSASNPVTVTTAPAGTARTLLQPNAADGKTTYTYFASGMTNCANYGAADSMFLGTTSSNRYRVLTSFDLRDIPAGAEVTRAEMSLWQSHDAKAAVTVEAHRVTRAWGEGVAGAQGTLPTCTGGATWYDADTGAPWSTAGGDFDASVASSVTVPAGSGTAFRRFDLAALAQSWVSGSAPNHGVLLKAADETFRDAYQVYASDDTAGEASQRPQLLLEYRDGSTPKGPAVAVSAPAVGEQVQGTKTITATASDDRRVEQVSFRVDGANVGSDTSSPYTFSWNTSAVSNGSHTLTVVATDDAGNSTTSSPVAVDVRNSTPPTASLSSPPTTATGTVTLTASAADDQAVTRVEFFVDDQLVGAPDTTVPFQVAWNTLDPAQPAFDGPHNMKVRAYDAQGQVSTPGAGSTVTVANATTAYKAGLTSSELPPTVTWDPAAGAVQESYGVDVTIANNTGATLASTNTKVGWRWYAPGSGTAAATGSVPLSVSISKGKSGTARVLVPPPALPDGVDTDRYTLRMDLLSISTGAWFSDKGNPPVEKPVIVVKKLATALGLERYYGYDSADLGAGMSNMVNVANGNNLLRITPLSSPGRGLSTLVGLTYNSLEEHSDSPAGNNWSVAVSGLTRFGQGLDIHPNNADQVAGRSNKYVTFVDGDGTRHRFTGATNPDSTTTWSEPAGVNLYLRTTGLTGAKYWALTRPDNVTFYFDQEGYPTSVVDRNGNTLTFALSPVIAGDDPGGSKKRVTTVTDAGGGQYRVDYYTKDTAKKPQVRGKIASIADHSGHRIRFDYYDDGNLLRLTEDGGLTAAGGPLPERSWVFTYMNNNGTGPALAAAERVSPDPSSQAARSQSSKVFSVRSPRDTAAGTNGKETTFTYFPTSSGPLMRWRVQQRTPRDNNPTTFAYDPAARTATVSEPQARVTTYAYGVDGSPTRISRDLAGVAQHTYLSWTADRQIASIADATTASSATGVPAKTFTYNANGYPASITNQDNETTKLDYANSPVDARDSGNHLSVLTRRTNPKGTATAGDLTDYATDFGYDAKGNLTTLTFPKDTAGSRAGASNTYNGDGTLATSTNARGKATLYVSYHSSGQPKEVRDPLGRTTRVGYDADGRTLFVQDPLHAGVSADPWSDPARRSYATVYDYDSFGRSGRTSTPKSRQLAAGVLIWASQDFDPNDNVTRSEEPQYGFDDPGDGPATTYAYDPADRVTSVTSPDTSADPAGERTTYTYDSAGRSTQVTSPKGTATAAADDFATGYIYDELDRVIRTERREVTGSDRVERTHACYNTAGDLVSTTAPRANLPNVTCPATQASGFTTTYTYDAAHRVTGSTDAEGRTTSTAYDDNGNAISGTDAAGTVGTVVYDERDRQVRQTQKFDLATGGHDLVTQWRYDANSNVTEMDSPRASDAGNGDYTTRTEYDDADQPVRTLLPTSAAAPEQAYVHKKYDDNGNLTLTSLATTQATVTAANPLPAAARTELDLFDTGWIQSSDDGVNPQVSFDYTPQGWQSMRVPAKSRADATADTGQEMSWTYYADGMKASIKDRGAQVSQYTYDANNQLLSAVEGRGLTDPGETTRTVQARYDGFDRLSSVYHKRTQDNDWKASAIGYDLNGNVVSRDTDGNATAVGANITGARRHQMTYGPGDRMEADVDYGRRGECADDRRTSTTWTVLGLQATRVIAASTAGCASGDQATDTADATTWTATKQTTAWSWLLNSKLKSLSTKDRSGATVESHTVGYLDDNNDYVGQRTSDAFTLSGPGSTACASATCTANYVFDPRERVTRSTDGHGGTTTYALDQPSRNQVASIRAGNVTSETTGATTTTRDYDGNQISSSTVSNGSASATSKYWHDNLGNLDCVTTASGSAAACSPAQTPDASLVSDYEYDYLDRLRLARTFAGGAVTDTSRYTYDALDRLTRQSESHTGSSALARTTQFSHEDLSDRVAREEDDTEGAANISVKDYSYDPFGHRLTMADQTKDRPSGTVAPAKNTYTYGYDVHGSVSALLDDGTGSSPGGPVKAVYGYTPYGGSDTTLSKGDTDPLKPVNPFRYTGKRLDTGTGSLDMGARRYSPDTGRFFTTDKYYGATADLGLSADPLSGNRYALAAGSPLGFVEVDGHMTIADGGGTAASNTGIAYPLIGSGGSDHSVSATTSIRHQSQASGGGALSSGSTSCLNGSTSGNGRSPSENLKDARGDAADLVGIIIINDAKDCWAGSGAGCALLAATMIPGPGWLVKGGKVAVKGVAAAKAGGVAAKTAEEGFGGLTRAAEFGGVRPYNALRGDLKGTGLQAHHLTEQRFARTVGQSPKDMPSVAVTQSEHQVFTNAWRKAIPYGANGTGMATGAQIDGAAGQIYASYPEILSALGLG